MARRIDWSSYLDAFHEERPGIVDDLLSRAVAGHHNPYEWLARTVSARATTVLDVACGAGPVTRALERPGRTVVGVDVRPAELIEAQARSRGAWLCADARALPLADHSVDAAVSMLGMVMIHPTDQLLAEVARVLRPGGVLAFVAPALGPVSPADLRTVLGMSRHLRGRPQFPGSLELTSFKPLLARHGLRKVEDSRERYRVPIRSHADADTLVRTLLLPTKADARIDAAIGYLARQVRARGEVHVPVPMRRFVAIK